MDFIRVFPKVGEFKSIFMVVDRFSKYVIFIPSPHACPMEEVVRLFFNHVVKCFRMPKDIVSDYDARFTGWFQIKLFKLLGWELKFSIENHPQTDRQTKCTNTLLEEYLKHYVFATQMNWVGIVEINPIILQLVENFGNQDESL